MTRWICAVLYGCVVSLATVGGQAPSDFGPEPEVEGDPTGRFRKKLEGIWGRGDPKALDRIELAFTWHRRGGPIWVKRPAIRLTTYRKGNDVRHEYGPIFLETSGKHVFKWGDEIYEYDLQGATIRLKRYTPPFQFDEGKGHERPDSYDMSGVWTKQPEPEERDAER